MRRIYKKKKSRKELLQELGCVVWIKPDGSFKDEMTGNAITTSGQGTITWNSITNMYDIITPSSSGNYVATINTGLDIATTFSSNSFSVIATVQKPIRQTGGQVGTMTCYIASNIGHAVNIVYNDSVMPDTWPTTVFDFASILSSTGRNYYPNQGTWLDTSAYAPYLPTNWPNPLRLYLGCAIYSNGTNKSVSLGEYMLFNRALTKAEIHSINSNIPAL